MATLKDPVFIETDPNVILRDCISYYESLTGKVLNPAQAEMLLINLFAYREVTTRNQVQEACKQNLINFSTAPMLDHLTALLGVERLPASPAEATFSLSLIPGHGTVTIPQGIRFGSSDGQLVFITKESRTVGALDNLVEVPAACSSPGEGGNGYVAGSSWNLLDPLSYVEYVENLNDTSGGSDEESDEELRARFKLAPSAFSVAGPEDAYIFHAKSAHPSIIDVGVDSLEPGTVNIYPLVDGGVEPSTEVIDAVYAKLSAKKVRPLNDIVVVSAPTKVDYDIVVNLTLFDSASPDTIAGAVTASLNSYADLGSKQLGADRIVNQIIGLSQVPGVYKAVVVQPSSDIIINKTSFAKCGSVTVNVTGFNIG